MISWKEIKNESLLIPWDTSPVWKRTEIKIIVNKLKSTGLWFGDDNLPYMTWDRFNESSDSYNQQYYNLLKEINRINLKYYKGKE